MSFNLTTNIEECLTLINTSYPLSMIYYSHISSAIVSLALGTFVFIKNRKALSNKILFAISIVFSLWVACNFFIWTGYNSAVIMLLWSFFGILTALLFILSLYLTYVFINKKDVGISKKVLFLSLLLPVIFLTPTTFNLSQFSIVDYCEATENKYFLTYYHLFGPLAFFWILFLVIPKYRRVEKEFKKQILLFTIGIEFFILTFFMASYVASLVDNYEIEFIGLFAMSIFMGFLAYLIVKYKAFEIRLLGVQALVYSQIILIASQFAFIVSFTNKILTGITLFISIVFGWVLIRSVKAEIKRKEELQIMATKLAIANDKLRKLDSAKSDFISIASHQLRTPLTAIKGFVSMLLEGSYGKLNSQITDVLNKVYISNERLITLVEDLLNVSKIESGRMEYDLQKTNLAEVCQEIFDTFIIRAKDRQLKLEYLSSKTPIPEVTTDRNKIREVISNLVDNAIKYTPKGGVTISLMHDQVNNLVQVRIKDTGIGVPQEELPYLFEKFSRGKDINRLNTGGTGLGLHVGKSIIEALHGKIRIESAGVNMGSTFIVEVPGE